MPCPLMKKGKSLMTPREIERMMDFILRSQADAAIRMEQSEEQHERWLQRIDDRLERAIAAVEQAAKLSRDAMRETRASRTVAREHEKKIKTIQRSHGFLKRRSDDMKQLMKLVMRLLDHQSKRLDALESRS